MYRQQRKELQTMLTQKEKSELFQGALSTASIQYINEGNTEDAQKMLSLLESLRRYSSPDVTEERGARLYDILADSIHQYLSDTDWAEAVDSSIAVLKDLNPPSNN
jgi:hypothetical protein